MITKTFLETCSKVTAITENNCGKYFQSALREKCPNTEFFWSVFSLFGPEKNSVFGYFHPVVVLIKNVAAKDM